MVRWRKSLTDVCVALPQAYGSGVFELDLHEFKNDYSLLSNGLTCGSECRTFFRVCLKNYQTLVTPGECVFGSYITPVLGTKSFNVMKNSGVNKAVRLPIDFRWPVRQEPLQMLIENFVLNLKRNVWVMQHFCCSHLPRWLDSVKHLLISICPLAPCCSAVRLSLLY